MTRVELEALFYRMQNAYPAAKVGGEGTIDEWSTSTIMRFPVEVVFAAFDAWRESALWPPTLADLLADSSKMASAAKAASEQAAIAAANFEDDPAAWARGELRTYSCGGCLDQRWLPMDPDDESKGVYPCPDCRPMVYERWKGGHFLPGHTCAECIALRSRRVHAA